MGSTDRTLDIIAEFQQYSGLDIQAIDMVSTYIRSKYFRVAFSKDFRHKDNRNYMHVEC